MASQIRCDNCGYVAESDDLELYLSGWSTLELEPHKAGYPTPGLFNLLQKSKIAPRIKRDLCPGCTRGYGKRMK